MIKLPSIKFVHSIAILSIVLISGILIEFFLYFSSLYKQWEDAKVSVDAVLISEKLDKITYHHGKERGLTAGFLGSNGQRFGNALKSQRQLTDNAVADLFAIGSDDQDGLSEPELSSATQRLADILTEKNSIRQKVDALNIGVDAFDYYSTINAEALNTASSISLLIKENDLKVDMDNLYSLIWVKERAGQIRGKLNGIFASGSLSAAQYFDVKYNIENEQRSIDTFKRFAKQQYIDQLNQFANSALWAEVSSTATLNESDIDGIVSDPSGDKWFEIATQRIDNIATLSDSIRGNLKQDAGAHLKSTAQTMLFKSLTMGLLITIIAIINYFIISSLKKRVVSVDSTLKNISENSDLSLRLDDGRNDEFGQIGKAIDAHLTEVCQVFDEFNQASKNSMAMIGSISDRVDSANTNASDQNQRSEQIFESMRHLLTSASDVSSNMDNAKDSMQSATLSAEKSRDESEAMRNIFSDLSNGFSSNLTTIEELANHSQEISSILDTISGIAEQTNLLALNAAIEAARAGEQGRGFAVVADEVRSLAQKTQESTTNIRDMIERLNSSSQSALHSMQDSQARVQETESRVETSVKAVDSVNSEINNVKQIIQKVASAAKEQAEMINTVELNVSQMNELSQDTLDKTQAVNSDTQGLSAQMAQLDDKIRSFKI